MPDEQNQQAPATEQATQQPRPPQQNNQQQDRKQRNMMRQDGGGGGQQRNHDPDPASIKRAMADVLVSVSTLEDMVSTKFEVLSTMVHDANVAQASRQAALLEAISREHESTRMALEYTQRVLRAVAADPKASTRLRQLAGNQPTKAEWFSPGRLVVLAVVVAVVAFAAVMLG